jgi:hypothetical protein
VGQASDELKSVVTLAVETLRRYAGMYDLRLPQTPTPIGVEVTLSAGKLWMNGFELIPTSETTFVGQERVDFAVNDRGEVIQMSSTGPVATASGHEGRLHSDRVRLTNLFDGHWDGDDLVIETAGLNAKAWLDQAGPPPERGPSLSRTLHSPRFLACQHSITIDDPTFYAAPWTVTQEHALMADDELRENIGLENENDADYQPGK